MNSDKYIYLNARGTIIQAKMEIAEKSPVLKNLINGQWMDTKEPYYLDYEASVVHALLDYLAGRKINSEKLEYITDELLIELDKNIVMDWHKLQKLFEEFKNKFEEFKKIMNEYNCSIDKYNLQVFLTMLSYYEHVHLENIFGYRMEYNDRFQEGELEKIKIIEQAETVDGHKYVLYEIFESSTIYHNYNHMTFTFNNLYFRNYTLEGNIQMYILILFDEHGKINDKVYDSNKIKNKKDFMEKITKYNFEDRILKDINTIAEINEDTLYFGKYPMYKFFSRNIFSIVNNNKNYDLSCYGNLSIDVAIDVKNAPSGYCQIQYRLGSENQTNNHVFNINWKQIYL